MSDILITGKDLSEKNSAAIPQKATEFAKNSFWHYTKLSTVEKIFENRCIHVSSFATMNDLDEADLHWEKRGDVFALCFSNSGTEKIPMWYLYSGIDGNGAAIRITPTLMIYFVSSIENVTVLDGKYKGKILKRGIDFDIQFGWVYYNPPEQRDRFFYRNKWYRITDDLDVFLENNFFLKRYPWEYEQEFRIVFINKRKETFSKISVPISDKMISGMRLMLAPEINRKTIEETIAKYPEIKEHLYRNIKKSKLAINMNLLERNKTVILGYVQAEAKERGAENRAKQLINILNRPKVTK